MRKTSYGLLFLAVVLVGAQSACVPANSQTTTTPTPAPQAAPAPEARPEYKTGKRVIASKAAVSCAHPEAAKVGIEILEKGGNAWDAAIAIQFALAVVYPKAGNIGGGGFCVSRSASGELYALDYREEGPGASSRDMYLDAKGNVIPDKSVSGHWACGVPGTVAGLAEMHKKAKLTWAELVQPAIDLAEKGFKLTNGDAKGFNKYMDKFVKYCTSKNAITAKSTWKKGDVLIQKDLAETLKRIRDKGRAGFYEGETADLIVKEMAAGKGLITKEDLKVYEAKERTPLTFDYTANSDKKDYKLISMSPPSSGGICLAQMLRMLELSDLPLGDFHSAQAIHLMTELERRAYADRATHLGDPDFWKIPKNILGDKYLKSRIADFKAEKATPSKSISAGVVPESEQTTHLSVIDENGNAVAVTTTLNSNYGNKVIVTGAGFFLNNEMDDFSAKAGVPNQFGLVGNDANAVAPRKRMLSSMTPTIVVRRNEGKEELFMVVGTPGGGTIITSVFQVFLNVTEFGMNLSDAVNASRVHHQWLPDKIFIEAGALSEKTIAGLKKMGHTVETRESIGQVDAILVQPDGQLEAVGDRRSDDTAAGY